MSASSSIVPAAIDYLLAELPTLLDLDDTQIAEGWPGNAVQREAIIIGSATSDQEWKTLGAWRKSEDATVTVYITVHQPGQDATSVRQRAYELADVVDTWLRSSTETLTLGRRCVSTLWAPIRWEPAITDQGRAGILECELRLTGAHL